MSVAFVMALELFTSVAVSVEHVVDQEFLREIVIATETYSMSVERVEDQGSHPETVTVTETYSMSVEHVAD
jgi:hypothetical protein